MSTETRTTSATGGQKGVKEQRHDLLPRTALDAISEVYAFGAIKYADHNWRRGYEWSKSYAALQRHLTAWWDGESLDPESGLSHLGHAGFHVFALLTWLAEQGEGVENAFDDRWPHGMARRDAEADEVISLEARMAEIARGRKIVEIQEDLAEIEPLEDERVTATDIAGPSEEPVWTTRVFNVQSFVPEGFIGEFQSDNWAAPDNWEAWANLGKPVTFDSKPVTMSFTAHGISDESIALMVGDIVENIQARRRLVGRFGDDIESFGPDLPRKRKPLEFLHRWMNRD